MELVYLIPLLMGLGLLAAVLIAWAWLARPAADRVEYPDPDFTDRAGFRFTDLPADPLLTQGKSWLLQRYLAQLDFTVEPGWSFWLRAAKSGRDLKLQEVARVYHQRQTQEMEGVTVTVRRSPGGAALYTWSRDGMDLALYFPEGEMGLAGGLADDFIRETRLERT